LFLRIQSTPSRTVWTNVKIGAYEKLMLT